jgi:hypothetical protein
VLVQSVFRTLERLLVITWIAAKARWLWDRMIPFVARGALSMSSAVLKTVRFVFQLADLVYKITASVIAMFFMLLLQARTSLQLCYVGFVYTTVQERTLTLRITQTTER